MADLIGATLGNYRIIEQIGRGGMATVYKAYQPALDRHVAIKVIHEQLASEDDQFLERFQREAKSVAALRHPNIVQVYDFGVQDNISYMVMEYLEGQTLKDTLKALSNKDETMPLAETERIFQSLANAVEYAHNQNMVHRDIKPDNILLTVNGNVVLADFGIARIVGGTQYTAVGAFIGTPAYISPEQGQGERGDKRSDIYAMGIVLYEMLTGQVPFDADTPWAVVLKHISAPLPLPQKVNPTIPDAIELIVLKALAKNPDARYQHATDMADGLANAIANESTTHPEPVQSYTPETVVVEQPTHLPKTATVPFWHNLSRQPVLLIGVLLLLVMVVAGLLFMNGTFSSSGGNSQIGLTSNGRIYRLEAKEDGTLEEVSTSLDELGAGEADILLAISSNGEWLLLSSDRFDPDCAEWRCLSLVKGDLSAGESVRTANDGEVIHPQNGSSAVISSDGKLVIYRDQGDVHESDLWAITRNDVSDPFWSAPQLITGDSGYEYQMNPVLSKDEERLLFSCSEGYYGYAYTAICEVGTNGADFRVVLTPENGFPEREETDPLRLPAYAPDGTVLFNWGNGIWQLPVGSTQAVGVSTQYGTLFCVLPDGRLITGDNYTGATEGASEIGVIDVDNDTDFRIPIELMGILNASCGG